MFFNLCLHHVLYMFTLLSIWFLCLLNAHNAYCLLMNLLYIQGVTIICLWLAYCVLQVFIDYWRYLGFASSAFGLFKMLMVYHKVWMIYLGCSWFTFSQMFTLFIWMCSWFALDYNACLYVINYMLSRCIHMVYQVVVLYGHVVILVYFKWCSMMVLRVSLGLP
jgi:hypothetical protein